VPKGPNGEKRPADTAQNAFKVFQIAVGDDADAPPDDGKDPAAKALGKKGGEARAQAMTPRERSEISRKAAKARWAKRVDVEP
jgi:hypothetical protein